MRSRPRRRDPDLGAGLHVDDRKKSSIRSIDLNIDKAWKDFAGGGTIPYLGVGAHSDWADANPTSAEALHHYKLAWNGCRRTRTRRAVAGQGRAAEELKAVAAMIKSNERLAMKLTKAGEIKKDIQAVYKAAWTSTTCRACRRMLRSTTSR